MSKPILVIMTRWPAPYRCKKRLSNQIGANNAALIQNQLTIHTLSVAKKLMDKDLIEVRLAISGIGRNKATKWAKSLGFPKVSIQGKGNLGIKMRRQILNVHREKKTNAKKKLSLIIIGTDLPNLCETDLLQGLQKLKENDLILGPAKDGGYWLIGLAGKLINPVTFIPFHGINWGSNSVLSETISNISKHDINYHLIHQKNDLDLLSDINPWLANLSIHN